MQEILSIRWHSRAGQGAITASTALAEILGGYGKFVQSFPDFGAEKRGAPVVVFNRISNEKIDDASQPSEVDAAVLLDTSLISSCEIPVKTILEGLKKNGILLVNTPQKALKMSTNSAKVFAVNASEIAIAEIGKDIPNVPILGALIRILNLAKLENFSQKLEKKLAKNLPAEIVTGNLRAFKRGFEEVREIKSGKNGVKKTCEKLPDWKEIPNGAVVRDAGNSERYDTGNWSRQTCEWNAKTCIDCRLCWSVCPHAAVKIVNGKTAGVDAQKCTACGLCVAVCPTKPKSLKIVSKKSSDI